MVFANSSKIGQHKEGILKTSESVSRPGVKKTYLLYYIPDLDHLGFMKRQGYTKKHELTYFEYTFFMLRPLCEKRF
jgi:hypothetical protein